MAHTKPNFRERRTTEDMRNAKVPVIRIAPEGKVMTDFASISMENCRALPSGMRSVYFDVSSRVMNGWSLTSRRRSHLMCVFPSNLGNSSRSG
ncbi:hypothetical protein LX81_03385 [Palleronia aestuarii]|uniref:Uncharacterized protein n=1 Tax=Palleronia aestuarii TaxID=568105 RepID=A0A2W7MYI3_9RHOB|nr:hypothetical protein LX81_03385 [Palleronia aestuarii]